MNLLPHMNHDIPPMYSRYPPDVLMVSPRCTYWTRIVQGKNAISKAFRLSSVSAQVSVFLKIIAQKCCIFLFKAIQTLI